MKPQLIMADMGGEHNRNIEKTSARLRKEAAQSAKTLS